MEPEVITSPASVGGGTETPSQTTPTPSTEGSTPETPAQAPVDSSGQSPSSPKAERPKASEFYQARERQKAKLVAMETELRQLREQLQKIGSQPQATPPATPKPRRFHEMSDQELEKLYFENPGSYALNLAKQMKEQMEEWKQEIAEKHIPSILSEKEKALEADRTGREALELLFPKDEKNPLALDKRIQGNPERLKRIGEIETELGFNQKDPKTGFCYSDLFPAKAAKVILKMLAEEDKAKIPPKNPAAPSKAQMVSTATGTPPNSNGGSKLMDVNEIHARRQKLQELEAEKPELRFSEKHIAERALLKNELSKRVTELKGQ